MGAIGDYIHFGRAGYNKHGITRNGDRDSYSFEAQKELMRKRSKMLTSDVSLKTKEKYEAQLNNIFSTYNANDKSIYKTAQNIIKQKLNEDFSGTMGSINWATANVSKIASAKSDLSKIQIKSQQKDVLLSTIVKRVRSLENKKDTLSKSKKRTELEKNIKNIYNELSQIVNLTEQELRELNLTELHKIKIDVDGWKNGNTASARKNYNLITLINKTITALSSPVHLQKGNLFEYGGALAGVMVKDIAQEKVEETLQQALSGAQGGKRSRTTVNFKKFFADGLINNVYMNKWEMNFNDGTAVSFLPSQEKIDIKVKLDGKDTAISAKNYNFDLGYNLGLLSGSSLLYLIQDESSNFVNHYLNLMAHHPRSSVSLSANFHGAHEAMKFTILYKAFSGDTYGREKASLFLVNDNSKSGGVKLYEMSELIDKAYKNIDAYAIFRGLPASESIKNRWKATPEERIAAFLSEVHKYKISVSLSPSILTN